MNEFQSLIKSKFATMLSPNRSFFLSFYNCKENKCDFNRVLSDIDKSSSDHKQELKKIVLGVTNNQETHKPDLHDGLVVSDSNGDCIFRALRIGADQNSTSIYQSLPTKEPSNVPEGLIDQKSKSFQQGRANNHHPNKSIPQENITEGLIWYDDDLKKHQPTSAEHKLLHKYMRGEFCD